MNISNLLRRALVHYSRCSGSLTLPPLDLESRKPNWAKNIEPFYEENRFHPLTVQDPSYVTFPVFLQKNEDQTISLINAHTGEQYTGKGLAFYDIPSDRDHAQLMESWQKDELLATVVVPDEVFEMAQPLFSKHDQFDALCNYCLMSAEEKASVKKFLTDTKSVAGLFHCLCFLSSYLAGTSNDLEDLDIPFLTDVFNRTFAHQLGIEPVVPEEVSALITAMKLSALSYPDELYSILTFCAVLNHCSRWQEHGSSIMNTMYMLSESSNLHISFLLQWCCDADMLRQVIQDALYMERRSNSHREFFEKLLLYCLTLDTPLHEDSIEDICSQMFRGELSQIRQNWIGNILASPNGSHFQAFIQEKYQQVWKNGQYLQAMAQIRNFYTGGKTEQAAQDLMLDSQEESEALLGAAMLSQFLWTVEKPPVTLHREHEIIQMLSHWALNPNPSCCTVTGELALALTLTCSIPRKALCQTELLAKACQCFNENATQDYAINLLGSVPLSLTIDAVEDPELLREELEWHFRKSLDEKDFLHTLLLFRACIVSGCWDRAEILYNTRKLAATERAHISRLNPLEKHFVTRTKEELFSLLFYGTIPTSETAWEHLTSPLCDSMRRRLEEIQHIADQKQPVYLTCSEDVMLVLRFLRTAGAEQQVQTAALVSYCTLAENISDSCLVSWFWILCCWNRRKEAMEYYLAHQSLLDRPWHSVDGSCLSLGWKNYSFEKFLNMPSRLQMGIYLAALLGNSTLVNDFLRSGLLDGPATEAAARVLYDLSLCKLPEELQFLSRKSEDMPENANYDRVRSWILQCILPLNACEFWRICWDDRGITRLALSLITDGYMAILDLGYSGEKEIAMAAIGLNPSSVNRIAPHLLKDDEVALAALRSSSFSLRSLKAPILQDHELVLRMIHENNVYPPLSMVPDWLCDSKEFVIHSLQKQPTHFFLASPRLRADAQVLITAMNALSQNQHSFVCNLLREADPALRSNRQVMTCAVSLYPDSFRMADESLRYDPQLMVLADRP